MGSVTGLWPTVSHVFNVIRAIPPPLLLLYVTLVVITFIGLLYLVLVIVAPIPRVPYDSEKTYQCILASGEASGARQLPCWYDRWRAVKDRNVVKDDHDYSSMQTRAKTREKEARKGTVINKPEVLISVVVPAYNEKDRLRGMLEEAIEFLQSKFITCKETEEKGLSTTKANSRSPARTSARSHIKRRSSFSNPTGWEILFISDGSTDSTVSSALDFARIHLSSTINSSKAIQVLPESIRVISLVENRGKGGAVIHGMRHVRGKYVLFADADGASRFADLGKLLSVCEDVADEDGRALVIGSRAHLVTGETVVKRSLLRNFLMHAFHLFLRLLTPPATSRIRDTQCGFKLLTRSTLPHIIPYMHAERWIFDVEMLMLAEMAHVPVKEVDIGWTEVGGSKLSVWRDSIGMAWDLAVLRAAWAAGVYRRL